MCGKLRVNTAKQDIAAISLATAELAYSLFTDTVLLDVEITSELFGSSANLFGRSFSWQVPNDEATIQKAMSRCLYRLIAGQQAQR